MGLSFFFLLLNIIDYFTAYSNKVAEANPLYIITGNMLLLLVFKALISSVIIGIALRNTYPNKFSYYNFLLILVLGIGSVILGIYSNVQVMLNPELIQQAANISNVQKVKTYVTFFGFFMMIPWLLSLISFWLFQNTKFLVEFKNKKDNLENKVYTFVRKNKDAGKLIVGEVE